MHWAFSRMAQGDSQGTWLKSPLAGKGRSRVVLSWTDSRSSHLMIFDNDISQQPTREVVAGGGKGAPF